MRLGVLLCGHNRVLSRISVFNYALHSLTITVG